MSQNFIDLNRRFAEYVGNDTPEKLAEKSYSVAFAGGMEGLDWGTLLEKRLVVILGEPGSGKTQELMAQHKKFTTISFFFRLRQLVHEEFCAALGSEEFPKFENWKNGDGEATFFMDGVDESKIQKNDDFFLALERVKKELGTSVQRARFVISSRISEWNPQADSAAVVQVFGAGRSPELIRKTSLKSDANQDVENKSNDPEIFLVTILPLNSFQIRDFAIARWLGNPDEFMSALLQSNASGLAGRPLDVTHLYAHWRQKGHLANLTELTDFMVERLLSEVPNKEKQDILTPECVKRFS